MRPKLNKKRLVFVLILAVLVLAYLAVSGRIGNTSSVSSAGEIGNLLLLEPSTAQTTDDPEAPQELLPIAEEPEYVPEETEEAAGESEEPVSVTEETALIPEDGSYTSAEDIALYLYTYGRLPDNFITKKEAKSLGWEGGSLEPFAPGKCIGGDRFGNYEGLLPEQKGRVYYECDVNTLGARSRGAERIIFSNDGLIYYTGDHYESFELLYGNE